MKIGLMVAMNGPNATAAFLRAVATGAEQRGFESLWCGEHVVMFDHYDSPYPYTSDGRFPDGLGDIGKFDPFSTLMYMAAVTTRIRLGTGVCLIPQRNPVYTAKYVADLDVLSGGRVDFGVGIGWSREEYGALNTPWADRGKRLDEYLQVMQALWTQDTSSFDGELYPLAPCRLYPKPVQAPHPPIHVGGESDAAMKRAAKVGQGWYTLGRTADELRPVLARLDEHLAVHGRSRFDDDFEVSVWPMRELATPASVEAYATLGVDRLIDSCQVGSIDELLVTLDRRVIDVLEPARALG